MQKNFLSSNEPRNWEQIVTDAFSPDAEPHVFFARYQEKKQKLEESMMPKKRIHMRKPMMIAAAVLAAVVVVPSSAYAVSRIYNASVEPIGNYQQNVLIDVGEPASDSSASHQTMALQVGWMPDGITSDENGIKYHDAQNQHRCVTVTFWKVKEGENCLKAEEGGIVSQRTETINGNQVFFLQRNVTETQKESGTVIFDKVVWVAFTDTNYAVQLFATTGMTDDEMEKVVENLSLTPSDTETAAEWIAEEELNEEISEGEAEGDPSEGISYMQTVSDMSVMQLYQIGDTIPGNIYEDTVQVTVNSVELQDNFDGLPQVDCIGNATDFDYSQYLKEDGTIVDNVRTWYRAGDGVNTLDEEVRQETMEQKVVVMHLTYTNTGAQYVEDCICPYLFLMEEDGTLLRYTQDTEEQFYDDSCELGYDGGSFLFETEGEHFKNNLLLKAGESADVVLAFVVNTEDLDKMYLMADPTGSGEAEEIAMGSPVLDLRELAKKCGNP